MSSTSFTLTTNGTVIITVFVNGITSPDVIFMVSPIERIHHHLPPKRACTHLTRTRDSHPAIITSIHAALSCLPKKIPENLC
ncbi:hypothetical protein RRG08_036782 [Elysia crispata]|uniref:Uncharacterized protein n=1 Tax=Elysia crispata TaxID=231223 RepID=A0AAE1ADV2_9GAST|nr:hypothetical protein RRG08_036782 [Elysia crispata]